MNQARFATESFVLLTSANLPDEYKGFQFSHIVTLRGVIYYFYKGLAAENFFEYGEYSLEDILTTLGQKPKGIKRKPDGNFAEKAIGTYAPDLILDLCRKNDWAFLDLGDFIEIRDSETVNPEVTAVVNTGKMSSSYMNYVDIRPGTKIFINDQINIPDVGKRRVQVIEIPLDPNILDVQPYSQVGQYKDTGPDIRVYFL